MAYKFKSDKNKSIDNALTRLQASMASDQQLWIMERCGDQWGVGVVYDPETVENSDDRMVAIAYGKAQSLYDAISIATIKLNQHNQNRAKHKKNNKLAVKQSNKKSID